MEGNFKIYNPQEIAEMFDTWANFNGFSGETCGKCKKTANVFAYGAGWFCECGSFNVQSFSNAMIPHENPDMGTPRSVINEGAKLSKKLKKFFEV